MEEWPQPLEQRGLHAIVQGELTGYLIAVNFCSEGAYGFVPGFSHFDSSVRVKPRFAGSTDYALLILVII